MRGRKALRFSSVQVRGVYECWIVEGDKEGEERYPSSTSMTTIPVIPKERLQLKLEHTPSPPQLIISLDEDAMCYTRYKLDPPLRRRIHLRPACGIDRYIVCMSS